MTAPAPSSGEYVEHLDAVIIGAGFSGIATLYQLQRAGFNTLVLEQGAGIGGTWHWNRYPGARTDSDSYTYCFDFDEDLLQEWTWKEHFTAQPDLEAYFNHVVDRFGLRDQIRLGVKVETARYDDVASQWEVITSDGRVYLAQYLIPAVGILSEPKYPEVPGIESFEGVWCHTARWPQDGIDLEGKTVAVVGTGSSGVQLIANIADFVDELFVFQRSASWVARQNNAPLAEDEFAAIKQRYAELLEACRSTRSGFVHQPAEGLSARKHTKEERRQLFESLWHDTRGFGLLMSNYPELRTDLDINEEFQEFIADKIRVLVNDPNLAEKLIPKDHVYGGKRPPMADGYLEKYNRGNVHLVDLSETPISSITPRGIATSEAEYSVDVIIYASGFDAATGAFNNIDIQGTREDLKQRWKDGPVTLFGVATPGFPNLLMAGGPQALTGNIPVLVNLQTRWIARLLAFVRSEGYRRIEVDERAAEDWAEHVNEMASGTLFNTAARAWHWGTNVEGKPRSFATYPGGVVEYSRRINESEENGYAGFVLE